MVSSHAALLHLLVIAYFTQSPRRGGFATGTQTLFFASSINPSYLPFSHVRSSLTVSQTSSPEGNDSEGPIFEDSIDGLYSVSTSYREISFYRDLLWYGYRGTADSADVCPTRSPRPAYIIGVPSSTAETSHSSSSGRLGGQIGPVMMYTNGGDPGTQTGTSARKIPITLRSLRLKSLSYDPVSELVLMHVAAKDDSRFTLTRGRPCEAVLRHPSSWFSSNCPPSDGGAAGPSHSHRGTNDTAPLEVLFYNAKTLEYARVGPFAYYDSRIYFILQRFEKPDYRTKLNVIELRRMESVCKDGTSYKHPVTATSSTFEIIDCSTLVANVTQEAYVRFHAYRPLDSLIVVPHRPSSTASSSSTSFNSPSVALHFYFQLQRLANLSSTSVDVSIVLYHAVLLNDDSTAMRDWSATNVGRAQGSFVAGAASSMLNSNYASQHEKKLRESGGGGKTLGSDGRSSDSAHEGSDNNIGAAYAAGFDAMNREQNRVGFETGHLKGAAEALHEQTVNSEYLKYVLLQLGGLTHRRRTLCWAVIDRIVCSRLNDSSGRIERARTYLDVGQAAEVCRAPPGAEALRNVVTGLALAASAENREIVLYFGCVAQTSRGGLLGGAGLLRMPENQVWPAHITALRLRGNGAEEYFHAGAMFLINRCRPKASSVAPHWARVKSAGTDNNDDIDPDDDDYDYDAANHVDRPICRPILLVACLSFSVQILILTVSSLNVADLD